MTSDLRLRIRLGSGELGTGGGDERPVGREHARARPGASYLTRDANDRGSAVAAKKAGLRATCLLLDPSPATLQAPPSSSLPPSLPQPRPPARNRTLRFPHPARACARKAAAAEFSGNALRSVGIASEVNRDLRDIGCCVPLPHLRMTLCIFCSCS